jgi:hypothetical protein
MCMICFLVLELSAEEREDVLFKQVKDNMLPICYGAQNFELVSIIFFCVQLLNNKNEMHYHSLKPKLVLRCYPEFQVPKPLNALSFEVQMSF